MGRLSTIMKSAPTVHMNDAIKTDYINMMQRRCGRSYLKDFYRPAYAGTCLEQKDIHEYYAEEFFHGYHDLAEDNNDRD